MRPVGEMGDYNVQEEIKCAGGDRKAGGVGGHVMKVVEGGAGSRPVEEQSVGEEEKTQYRFDGWEMVVGE